jgi:hypothetical protein
LVKRAGTNASERYSRVTDFVKQLQVCPGFRGSSKRGEELYEEIGIIGMTLIDVKVKRASGNI